MSLFEALDDLSRRHPEARLEGCPAGPSPFEGRFAATSG